MPASIEGLCRTPHDNHSMQMLTTGRCLQLGPRSKLSLQHQQLMSRSDRLMWCRPQLEGFTCRLLHAMWSFTITSNWAGSRGTAGCITPQHNQSTTAIYSHCTTHCTVLPLAAPRTAPLTAPLPSAAAVPQIEVFSSQSTWQ